MTSQHLIGRKAQLAGLFLGAAMLAGCGGGSTYGTGVSQETQLLSDIVNIASLKPKKKEPIDYSSRPRLVKPPKDGALPQPTEDGGENIAAFPVDPETRQAALRAGKKKEWTRRDGGVEHTLPGRAEGASIERGGRTGYDPISRWDDGTGEKMPSAGEMAARGKKDREYRLKRMRELAGRDLSGDQPRRYLTEPPSEYRTPADSAPIGVTGDIERKPDEKESLIGKVFGRKKN